MARSGVSRPTQPALNSLPAPHIDQTKPPTDLDGHSSALPDAAVHSPKGALAQQWPKLHILKGPKVLGWLQGRRDMRDGMLEVPAQGQPGILTDICVQHGGRCWHSERLQAGDQRLPLANTPASLASGPACAAGQPAPHLCSSQQVQLIVASACTLGWQAVQQNSLLPDGSLSQVPLNKGARVHSPSSI